VYPILFQFGPFAVPTYGMFSALAMVAMLLLVVHGARRLALPQEKLWNLTILALLASLIASKLLLIPAHFWMFRTHPFWLLGLPARYDPWIPGVSAALGIAIAWLYLMAEGLPLRRTLDALAPAITLGLGIQAMGAFLAGANFGTPTRVAWAVTYHSTQASLWYGTPLGLPLQPTQLYHAGLCALLLLALLLWLPRRTQDGELAGLWLFTYGIARFFLQFYRGAASPVAIFTPVQWIALAMVLASAALLWKHPSTASPLSPTRPEIPAPL
jgi:phosphatidylglycerol:prolipoprotein diacylglycerol transferase